MQSLSQALNLIYMACFEDVQNTSVKMVWIAHCSCYVLSTSAIRIVKRNIFCILLLMASSTSLKTMQNTSEKMGPIACCSLHGLSMYLYVAITNKSAKHAPMHKTHSFGHMPDDAL